MRVSRVFRPVPAIVLGLLGLGLTWPGTLRAQAGTARVQAEENFRAEPNGTVLGRLRPGVELQMEAREGQWVRATLEAWLWTRSLQIRDEGSYDLVVEAEGGENVRSEPSGEILGRLEEGTLLQEVERRPGWILFRRTGWIWGPSVELPENEGLRDDELPDEEELRNEVPLPPEPNLDRWIRSGGEGAAILTGPDGDTLGRADPGSELRVLARQGNWARIRMEGWVWSPESREGEPGDTTVFSDVTPEELAQSPERYTGRVVSLSLQFISLERAETIRTDFYENEPFLLTRAPSGERSFVYVAVPPDRLGEVEGITPLERINVVGRVRTVAAKLTGSPVLELLDLSRVRSGGEPPGSEL